MFLVSFQLLWFWGDVGWHIGAHCGEERAAVIRHNNGDRVKQLGGMSVKICQRSCSTLKALSPRVVCNEQSAQKEVALTWHCRSARPKCCLTSESLFSRSHGTKSQQNENRFSVPCELIYSWVGVGRHGASMTRKHTTWSIGCIQCSRQDTMVAIQPCSCKKAKKCQKRGNLHPKGATTCKSNPSLIPYFCVFVFLRASPVQPKAQVENSLTLLHKGAKYLVAVSVFTGSVLTLWQRQIFYGKQRRLDWYMVAELAHPLCGWGLQDSTVSHPFEPRKHAKICAFWGQVDSNKRRSVLGVSDPMTGEGRQRQRFRGGCVCVCVCVCSKGTRVHKQVKIHVLDFVHWKHCFRQNGHFSKDGNSMSVHPVI